MKANSSSGLTPNIVRRKSIIGRGKKRKIIFRCDIDSSCRGPGFESNMITSLTVNNLEDREAHCAVKYNIIVEKKKPYQRQPNHTNVVLNWNYFGKVK